MFCPNCGSKMPDRMNFCAKCGKKLPEIPMRPASPEPRMAPAPLPRTPERTHSTAKVLLIVFGSLAVVFLVVALSLLLYSTRNTTGRNQAVNHEELRESERSQSAHDNDDGSSAEIGIALPGTEAEAPGSDIQARVNTEPPVPEPSSSPVPAGTDYRSLVSFLNDNLGQTGALSLVASDMSEYPNVKLYMSYEDNDGEPILLDSPTAGITEAISGGEEIERTVRSVERLEGNEAIGFDILVDKSDSMSDDMSQMQNILQDFIRSMDYASGDHAEIISFDSYIMYMCTDTDDMNNLLNGISNMTPYGMTALYDALVTGIYNAGSRIGPNCVIAFTDGIDNQSSYTYAEVIQLALQKGIPLYLIGTGGADETVLSQMALETGGYYWNLQALGDMDEVLREIYTNQKNMYCIEYTSDAGADPYAPRTISCVLEDTHTGACTEHVAFQPVEPAAVKPHTSRYEIMAGDVSWTEANNICIANGGHLATITSQEEMDTIVSLANASGLKYLWIGGYTSVRNNTAFGHWTTGESFDYTAWFPGEPSRNDKDGTPEFYLMLWYVQDYWSWNDQRDDVIRDTNLDYFAGNLGYVCEYEN